MYTVEGDRIVNENGDVAMRYYQNTGKLVKVGSAEYLFRTLNNMCIAWVKPEHISGVVAIKRNCCGNRVAQQFFLANEMQVRIWLGMSARP